LANQDAPKSNVIPLPVRPVGAAAAPEAKAEARAEERAAEAELIERARRGDQRAFRSLVEKYQRRVFGLALGILKNPDEARDVSQEAFLKAHRHLGTFQGSASFYTWIYRITVNLCIDLRRKAGRDHAEFDERLAPRDVGGPAASVSPQRLSFDPQRALHNAELRQRMMAALQELSETHRTVLLLREVEGLSYKEIAESMDCPEGTVMSRLFHARQKMQELLREFVDFDTSSKEGAPRA
jgi:RNA polymerase sigma-70 factor (ECF subfamily)